MKRIALITILCFMSTSLIAETFFLKINSCEEKKSKTHSYIDCDHLIKTKIDLSFIEAVESSTKGQYALTFGEDKFTISATKEREWFDDIQEKSIKLKNPKYLINTSLSNESGDHDFNTATFDERGDRNFYFFSLISKKGKNYHVSLRQVK